jgi:hypothetical protein
MLDTDFTIFKAARLKHANLPFGTALALGPLVVLDLTWTPVLLRDLLRCWGVAVVLSGWQKMSFSVSTCQRRLKTQAAVHFPGPKSQSARRNTDCGSLLNPIEGRSMYTIHMVCLILRLLHTIYPFPVELRSMPFLVP